MLFSSERPWNLNSAFYLVKKTGESGWESQDGSRFLKLVSIYIYSCVHLSCTFSEYLGENIVNLKWRKMCLDPRLFFEIYLCLFYTLVYRYILERVSVSCWPLPHEKVSSFTIQAWNMTVCRSFVVDVKRKILVWKSARWCASSCATKTIVLMPRFF